MSDLICVAFKDKDTADRALDELREMQREYLIDLEDACVAVREMDGKVRLKQAVNLVSLGSAKSGLSGMLWGSLVGLLFLNPLAGMALGGVIGAGTGALAGSHDRLWHPRRLYPEDRRNDRAGDISAVRAGAQGQPRQGPA